MESSVKAVSEEFSSQLSIGESVVAAFVIERNVLRERD
jgi:hypothetical protein